MRRLIASAALLLAGAWCSGQAAIDWWPYQSLPSATGELTIRRLGIHVPVVDGTEESSLKQGAGHLHGSANWGVPGNAVVAAHRDQAFRPLEGIRPGDVIEINDQYRYQYRVQWTRVVSPDDVTDLQPTENAVLTLITCFPFRYVGPAPKRYVVRAQLVKRAIYPI